MKMKKFFEHDNGTGIVLVANIATSAVADAMTKIEPLLTSLLLVGQILVAAASVYYIWRKARAVRIPGSRRRKR
jgi:hypothetical protein